jgi:ribonuclease P protein component
MTRQRLTQQKEFDLLFRKGSFVRAESFTVRYLPNHFDFSRLGVVVSKKVSKKAARRNRLKRQLVGWWQAHPIRAGYDVAVIVRRDQGLTPAQIETAFKKAGIVGNTNG